MPYKGQDATRDFNHIHSPDARLVAVRWLIGKVEGAPEPAVVCPSLAKFLFGIHQAVDFRGRIINVLHKAQCILMCLCDFPPLVQALDPSFMLLHFAEGWIIISRQCESHENALC